MRNVRAPLFIRLEQRTSKEGSFLRNVQMQDIDAQGAIVTSSITGVPGLRPSDITISNSRFHTVEQGRADWAQREIPEVADKYPEAWMMGHLPAYGFYMRHADRVKMQNVECRADSPDGRPAIVCDDVEDAVFAGLDLTAPAGGAPVFDLRNTRRTVIAGTHAPAGSKVLVQVSGAQSAGIKLTANTLGPDQQAVSFTNGAQQDSATVD
jgi:hypothetical protein